MPGKRVQFDDETWNALDLLAHDRMQDFQELADEAFRDLLAKHGRPTDLKTALRRSAGIEAEKSPVGKKPTEKKPTEKKPTEKKPAQRKPVGEGARQTLAAHREADRSRGPPSRSRIGCAARGPSAHLVRDFHQRPAAQPVGVGFTGGGELDDLREHESGRGVIMTAAEIKNVARLFVGALHDIDEVRIQGEILEAFPARHSNFLSGASVSRRIGSHPDALLLEHHRVARDFVMLDVSAAIIRPVGGEGQLKLLFLF